MNARRRLSALLASMALTAIAVPALAEPAAYTQPPIVVTPRDEDARINRAVVDALAADSRLSGRIGVETRDREVELSGTVMTVGQSIRAQRDAMGVDGVRSVQNHIATRVGPHTH